MPKFIDLSFRQTIEVTREAAFLQAGEIVTLRALAPGCTPRLEFLAIHGLNSARLEEIDLTNRSAARFKNLYYDNDAPFVVVKCGIDPLPTTNFHRPDTDIRA